MPGANITVDGITDRLLYDYDPPAAFFAEGEPTGAGVFNIADFGAVADPAIDNAPMIQAAIDAAHAAGGGIVYIPPGTYGVAAAEDHNGSVLLQSNVFLKGAGMGETTLRVVDGNNQKITGIVRSPYGEATVNYGAADFTLDGNRENGVEGAKVDGFFSGGIPGDTIADEDVYLLRMEIQNSSGYGFDPHEQTHRLLIQDSIAHDNGLDGFVADFLVDSHYVGNVAYDNDRHGFNIVTSTHDFLMTDNVAHSNGSAGITVQRGSEDITLPNNIKIEGGELYDNAREGILIKMSENILVTGVDVHDNGRYGIRIQGSEDVTIDGNQVRYNSQTSQDTYPEIQISDYIDAVTGTTYAGLNNLITGNEIRAGGDIRSKYGIEERSGEVSLNIISDNEIAGPVRGHLKLVGDGSYNQIVGDDLANEVSGTGTQDSISGLGGDDIIYGRDGADLLSGGTGDDWFSGGKHDDIIDGGAGNDDIKGDSGNDSLVGGLGDDTIRGGSGNDALIDLDGTNVLEGGSGDDVVTAGGVFNIIKGGSGNDAISTISGDATIEGGSGSDTIQVQVGNNALNGGSGDDIIGGGTGIDTISGGTGNDNISGDAGNDIINGGSHNDTIQGGAGDDKLSGSSGDDDIDGGIGIDDINGGSGNDVIFGGDGDDNLRGGSDDDVINGGAGADTISGGTGDDTIVFSGDYRDFDHDKIDGNSGFDTLDFSGITHNPDYDNALYLVDLSTGRLGQYWFGEVEVKGIERVIGSDNHDYIFGSDDGVDIYGGGGSDYIRGGAGEDRLEGGSGIDTLNGGGGSDTFVFKVADGEIDAIQDFEHGVDQIDLSGQDLSFDDLSFADAGYGKTTMTVGGHQVIFNAQSPESFTESDFIF